MKGVSIKKIVDKMNLKSLNPEVDVKDRYVTIADVNRPALQLSGYFEYFEKNRIQIIGMVEYTYLQKLSEDEKLSVYKEFLSYDIPCVIFCRNLEPDEALLRIAGEEKIPVFILQIMEHLPFMAELILLF